MVITHLGRSKPFVIIGAKSAEIGILTMDWINEGIKCTPKHLFRTICED